jgi:hypothetical protein
MTYLTSVQIISSHQLPANESSDALGSLAAWELIQSESTNALLIAPNRAA